MRTENRNIITDYEAVFNENETDGIFGISLVESPATKKYFLAMNDEKKIKEIAFKVVDSEKHILTGIVLEPDVPVRRQEEVNGEIENFTITFSEETIEKLAYNFYKQDFHKNSTIEHDNKQKIKGITFVESWIVQDPNNDKLNALGMQSTKGCWAVTMKVDDIDLWDDYIATGKVRGFSVDGLVQLKKINQKPIQMSVKDKLIAFKNRVVGNNAEQAVVEVKFGEIKMEGGEVIFEYDGETPVAGANIFAVDPADATNKIPVPVGEYPLEDGTILVVTVEGIIGEIKPKDEPAQEQQPAQAEPVQAPVGMATDNAVETANNIKSILIKYEEMNAKLDAIVLAMAELKNNGEGVSEIKNEIAEIKKEVLTFSEAPSKSVIPQTVKLATEMTKADRLSQVVNGIKN